VNYQYVDILLATLMTGEEESKWPAQKILRDYLFLVVDLLDTLKGGPPNDNILAHLSRIDWKVQDVIELEKDIVPKCKMLAGAE